MELGPSERGEAEGHRPPLAMSAPALLAGASGVGSLSASSVTRCCCSLHACTEREHVALNVWGGATQGDIAVVALCS